MAGNPSVAAVLGHPLQDCAQNPGKDEFMSKETRLEKETEWIMSMVITALGGQKVNIWGLMKGLLGLLNPWVLFLTRILGGRSLRASHTQFLGEERIPARCFPAPFTISGQAGPEEGVALPGPPTSLSPQRRWPSAKEAHLQYSQVWARTGMEASSHMSK